MSPLQLMAFMVATEKGRSLAQEALPDAPKVPYEEPKEPRTPVVRIHLAGLLRRTADRVDPCPVPSAA